jgi:hypothetical protein
VIRRRNNGGKVAVLAAADGSAVCSLRSATHGLSLPTIDL